MSSISHWTNSLITQSIPEETESVDDCSLSSMDDYYIIIDDQHKQELKYAEINEDYVEYEEFSQLMIIETPLKQHAKLIEHPKQNSKSTFITNRLTKFYKLNNLSKIIRSIKTRSRSITPSNNEPVLLQVKYFDGRPSLIDLNAQKSPHACI